MKRLMIVDDHDLARESLRDMLSDEPGIEVVAEATNGREALKMCSRVRPDLVLMDVQMPEMDGLTATREIKQNHPKTAVLMLTMYENPDYLLEALKAGAAGYILKDAFRQEIVSAVSEVLSGGSPLDTELAARLLRRLAAETEESEKIPSKKPGGAKQQFEPLTPRELEVLSLLKLGHTNRQIAENLYISTRTAKNHVEHIIAKLEVSDRTQAVVRALQLGLIELSA